MSSDGPQYPQYPGQEPDEGQGREPGAHPQGQEPGRQPGDQTPPPGGPPPPPAPPPPGQEWQASAYGQPGAPVGAATNQKAIWALVLGILGLVCCGIFTAIPALILGNMARKEVVANDGAQAGRGMAIAGIILGIVGIVLSLLLIAFWGYLFTTPEFQEGFREGYEGSQ